MKRVYLLGDPVAHSLSPAMQNAAFRALGLDWEYALRRTPAEQLAAAVACLRLSDCAGANVTIPHKERVVKLLDDTSPLARQIGAVNTIINRHGRLIGENTDVEGLLQGLCATGVETRGQRVAILGAGGAARAAAFVLASEGAARLTLLNRTTRRAHLLAGSLRAAFPALSVAVNDLRQLQAATLVVNATSVGMSPRESESPLPPGFRFSRGTVAFDLVYRPAETRFLAEAARAGAQTIGGLSMLIYQGAAAFKLWTGRQAPVDVMWQAARRELER